MTALKIILLIIKATEKNILPAVIQILADWAKADPSLQDIEDLKNRLPGDGNSYFE